MIYFNLYFSTLNSHFKTRFESDEQKMDDPNQPHPIHINQRVLKHWYRLIYGF